VTIPEVDSAAAVLLDFDGPVCAMFAGHSAPTVAAELRTLVVRLCGQLPAIVANEHDPLAVLRLCGDVVPGLVPALDDALTAAEQRAATTATPTPGAEDFIALHGRTRRPQRLVALPGSATSDATQRQGTAGHSGSSVTDRGPDLGRWTWGSGTTRSMSGTSKSGLGAEGPRFESGYPDVGRQGSGSALG
jgi:hypothetical protein